MKKALVVMIIILASLIFTNKLDALTGYTTESNVIVRRGPGVENERITMLTESNVVLDVVESKLYNPNSSECPLGWYKLNFNGSEAYICGEYVTLGNPGDNNPEYNTSTYEARIHGINIIVRGSANSNSTFITTLLPGTNIVILGDKVAGNGCDEGWYKIQYHKDQIGYVCSKYVNKKSDIIASDAEYEKVLKQKGFPDTYIPYLVYLISGEEGTKNLINSTLDIYRVNDIEVEKGWYQTTNAVNAFYLDPRNFLTEKFIFMFENLNYDYGNDNRVTLDLNSASAKMYYNTVKNIFGNSYLSRDEYVNMYIGAGFQYNVSPSHLASRTRQEGGTDENYAAVSGNYGELYDGIYSVKGYYNYYNIGAYGVNPVLRGLAYACGEACDFYNTYNRPWNTREKAIYGGAYYIADGYINDGQNTLYFQKFNTSPTSSAPSYTHQYQANVLAPSSESATTYTSYQEMGLLNLSYRFDIPVYNNMPEIVSLPTLASGINTLKEIKVNNKLISGYDEDIVDYTVYVDKSLSSVKIDATPSDNTSKINGTGIINLTGDTTEHKIIVTAENGNVKTYTLSIKKVTDSTTVDDILSGLSVRVTGSIMNHISPNTQINTLKQSILKKSPSATVTFYSSTGNTLNDYTNLATSQKIKITAPSGETKVFDIVVTGDTNGDGQVTILDLLRVQKHLLNSTRLTDLNLKAADTNSDNNITILDLLRIQKYIKKEISL